jgi:ribosomal protein S3AE
VAKFIPEAIGKDIEKSCQGIYPLQVRGSGFGNAGTGG